MSINLRTLDLNLLRILVAIEETGSVSNAGSLLGLSQPASSNALARLRQALNDPLFVRTRAGMIPTPFAERILPEIRRHLAGIFDTLDEESGFDPAQSERTFRLSLSGLGETVFLPRLAIRVMKAAPRTKLFNVSAPLSALAQTLAAGEADLAIGMVDIQERGVRSVTLFDEIYVAVAGAGLKGRPQTIDDLRRERIIMSAPAVTYAKDIEEAVANNGLAGNVVLRVGHFGALPQLLSQLDVVAIVPAQYARDLERAQHADLLPMSLWQNASTINMVWHEKTENDDTCVWLREQVRDLFSIPSR